MQLYDPNGRRKYLTPTERQEFIRASDGALQQIRTFAAPSSTPVAVSPRHWR